MIISRITIENFKQYAGEHTVELPSNATIGVIGANGVGKTTLFQAIEWALYGAAVAANNDIHPRGRSGKTTVTLTLDMNDSGEQYVVQRDLRKSTSKAVISRIEADGTESIIVQGTKPVTDYVQSTLIGLDHKAFTATFFTRQKELGFFGSMGDTERRREVGKLLGLETIRVAQKSISDERNVARQEAIVFEKQYEQQSQGHDFPAEIADANQRITHAQSEVASAEQAIEASNTDMNRLDQVLTDHRALKDRDNEIGTAIIQAQGDLNSMTQRRNAANADLERLDRRESEKQSLSETAVKLEALGTRMTELDELQRQFQRRDQLVHTIDHMQRRHTDAIRGLSTAVTSTSGDDAPADWRWTDADAADPVTAAGRLIAATAGIDLQTYQQQERTLTELRSTDIEREKIRANLGKYRQAREQLEQELASLTHDGDIQMMLIKVQEQEAELGRKDAELTTNIRHRADEITKTERLAANLRQHDASDVCPTCGRPFSEGDVQSTLDIFARQVDQLTSEKASLEQDRITLGTRMTELKHEHTRLGKRAEAVQTAKGRIEKSRGFIEPAEQELERLDRRMGDLLTAAARSDVPTDDDLTAARQQVQRLTRIVETAGQIRDRRKTLIDLAGEREPVERELASIGDVSYDQAEHRAVGIQQREAASAASAIAQIERELERRPTLISGRDQALAAIAETSANLESLQRQRADIGFDAAALATAEADVRVARERRAQAVEHRHQMEQQVNSATHRRDQLVQERDRIAKLSTDADARRKSADQLDLMYKEFDEFDRYAASFYAPLLGELTSEFVAEVTDGRYDRVQFDNNFGMAIYDIDDQKYPLDTFSGGERDAIALCARLALSRVIGGTGTQPPGFVVLDEVFGSLDRDRRQRLLAMLGLLTSSGEMFRQVFIISHVDDVRTAPIFDELWQVTETADGTSELHALQPGADIGEL